MRGGEDTAHLGGAKLGSVEAISLEDRTVDIKKRKRQRDDSSRRDLRP